MTTSKLKSARDKAIHMRFGKLHLSGRSAEEMEQETSGLLEETIALIRCEGQSDSQPDFKLLLNCAD